MIFLFFSWANGPKTCAVRNNTNLLSKLWPSADVEPCSGLMTPSPAADGRLVYLYLPVLVAAHQRDARRDGRDLSCATQDLGRLQMPVHQLPLFVMLLETKVWFPKLMQPALEFSNSCGSRCAGRRVGPGKTESCCLEKLQDSSMTFLIKRNHPTSAVLQSKAFSFLLTSQNETCSDKQMGKN